MSATTSRRRKAAVGTGLLLAGLGISACQITPGTLGAVSVMTTTSVQQSGDALAISVYAPPNWTAGSTGGCFLLVDWGGDSATSGPYSLANTGSNQMYFSQQGGSGTPTYVPALTPGGWTAINLGQPLTGAPTPTGAESQTGFYWAFECFTGGANAAGPQSYGVGSTTAAAAGEF